MHQLLVTFLIGLLGVSLVSFVVLGLLNRRRTRHLARWANGKGMRFSAGDIFAVSRRYARFAIVGAGHSPQASNVTYGRCNGLPVRAFDFRYEIGHGTRRLTKHYGVIVIETDRPLPKALVWHETDVDCAPMPIRAANRRLDGWRFAGDERAALALVEACRMLQPEAVSAEAEGKALMFCMPLHRWKRDYVEHMDTIALIGDQIASRLAPPAGA